jgi:uncharacterized membrane protein
MMQPWHLYVMAIIYLIAGCNHFRNPQVYVKIIPPFLPNPKLLNALVGAAEITFAILLCIDATSTMAAWGIITLLIAIFPSNVYMVINEKAGLGLPKWLLIVRLPMQLLLILWAYIYT